MCDGQHKKDAKFKENLLSLNFRFLEGHAIQGVFGLNN